MADMYKYSFTDLVENGVDKLADDLIKDMGDVASLVKTNLIQELRDAILHDGRLMDMTADPVIDARAIPLANNISVSVNASNLGDGNMDSIALGIINVDKEGNTRHRYSKGRIEISPDEKDAPGDKEEGNMAREVSEMENLFNESRQTLEKLGYTLEEIDGTENQFVIKDEEHTYGELIAGMDGREIVNVMINNAHTGEFTDIGSMDDVRSSVDKFFAYKEANIRAPEAVDNSFMELESRLKKVGYEVNPLGDEGRAFIVRYKNENLGAFDDHGGGKIGILTPGDYQLKAELSADTAFDHFQGLARIRDEQVMEEERLAELDAHMMDEGDIPFEEAVQNIAPLDEFVAANPNGFYVHVEYDGDEPIAYGLHAEDMKSYIEEHGIEAASTGEYADKLAHTLREEFDREKENIIGNTLETQEVQKDVEEKEKMPQELNLTNDMSEREMAQAVVDYVNDGREADAQQQSWIDSHSDEKVMKESDVKKQELNEFRGEMSGLKSEIVADNEKLADLNKQLDRQFSIAKMNGCEQSDIEEIQKIAGDIRDTTAKLNENRAIMAGMEEKETQMVQSLNQALRYERTQAIKGAFGKVQETLKKGVDLGLGTLGKIKDGLEKVNTKVMEYATMHERVGAYKDLVREVHELNKEYVNEMQYLKEELKDRTAELEKITQKAERMAEIKGTIKDLGRLLTGKEAQHDYSISDKDKKAIEEAKKDIKDAKAKINVVDNMYEKKSASLHKDIEKIGKEIEDKGKSTKDLFAEKMKSAFDRASGAAKSTHEAVKTGKDER